MKLLVINTGSSSVKFTLFQMDTDTVLAKGIIERIGVGGTFLSYKNVNGAILESDIEIVNIKGAVAAISSLLQDAKVGVIRSLGEIKAIGHRVVHGGEKIRDSVIIDKFVKQIIKDCFHLAPLHNPSNLKGIEACEAIFPGVTQIAVFDTAFHANLPEHAYLYGLPYRFYREDKIRRYGFHGTSHNYVSRKAAMMINKPMEDVKIVSCHLGNGASIAAIDGGVSIDTSMGLTPLEGLVMGTRCGDIDPAIIFYLKNMKNLALEQIHDLLIKQSGLLGLAEIGSSDVRDILAAIKQGNTRAKVAIKLYSYRIKKFIGAYAFAMGGLDAIVFTAGIGENVPMIRELVCQGLEGMGIAIDRRRNADSINGCCEIQNDDSRVKILVIPADEEKEIAIQTLKLVSLK